MRTRSKVAVDSYSKVFTCSGIREGLSIEEKGPVHWGIRIEGKRNKGKRKKGTRKKGKRKKRETYIQ